MNIYQENNGYVDVRKLMSLKIPFIFGVGARGIGKTFNTLDVVMEDEIPFVLMRRTQTKVDLINKPEFSPYNKINKVLGTSVVTKQLSKWNAGFYKTNDDNKPLGITCALSTIANMRGFELEEESKVLFYDEFIPEKHERPMKGEARALWNAYETLNRNRELEGRPPLQLICMANSDDLANPIFMDLGLVRVMQKMKKNGQSVYINRERGLAVFDFSDSEISEQKSHTALYNLKEGSEFNEMAIGNKFSSENMGRIKSRPLKEYKPICMVGELVIYEHKSKDLLYATTHKSGNPDRYGLGDADQARFKRNYIWVWDYYIRNKIEFEEYLCEILLKKVFM